jgi:hypothetical protein
VHRRLLTFSVVAVLLVTLGFFGWRALLSTVGTTSTGCTLGHGQTAVSYEFEQAADAATIAAVAKRRGLADHAVTIALATAMQESKLYNVTSGDRDSVGIFQQRPSQGWGTPDQLHDPTYAANAFFSHLAKVHDWELLPVATAAQMVQHSADGTAYAQWEEQARVLARALTGEFPAGLTCEYRDTLAPLPRELDTAARSQIGPTWTAGGTNVQHDWMVAEWLVAHSHDFGVVAVSVRGQQWTSSRGKWRVDHKAGAAPTYKLAAAPKS